MGGNPARIGWLAILAGFIVDNLISELVGAIGQSFDPMLAQGVTLASTAGIITSIFLVLSTGLGGWIAGRLAKREYVLHGTLVGGVEIILMLIMAVAGDAPSPLQIWLQFAAVLAGALGGYLSQWIPSTQKE